MDLLAAGVGLIWNVGLLLVLRRVSGRSAVFFVLAFYLTSLYTADRILPRVMVDAWPNFDAERSAALRPLLIFPDLVLVFVLVRQIRSMSRTAAWLLLPLVATTTIGLVVGTLSAKIPPAAAIFWATVPLRGIGAVLLVDLGLRTVGWHQTGRDVSRALILGAAFLAIQTLGVVAAKSVAASMNVDLTTVWSGFDWVRPNLPGWNNNITASMISLGAASALLLTKLHEVPNKVTGLVVGLSAVALLFAEYRTAIIVTVLAVATRVALWTFAATGPRIKRVGGILLASSAGVAVAAILLVAASTIVPRLADLNPATYAAEVISAPPTPVPARPTPDSQPPSSEPTPDPAEGSEQGDTSTESRAQIIQAALKVWARQPILGPGLGAWEFTRPTNPTFLQKAITPHNGIAWVLADLGMVGFVTFYVIPAALILTARPPLTLLVVLGLLALLEIAMAGIGHSRYALAYWSVIAFAAIGLREQSRDESRTAKAQRRAWP